MSRFLVASHSQVFTFFLISVGKELEPSSTEIFECAICLQTCVHPVRLPCSHIFCFLCIKGVAIQSKRCALCRQDIPVEFCSDPALLRKEDLLKELVFEGGYQWYYQGMNGWWQYDERTSTEIEEHYKLGEKTLEMLIAGFLYIIDFDNMLQYRRNDPTRRRKIKRDLITIPDRKGVAGLKILSPANDSPHRLDGDGGENVPCVVQQGRPSRTTRPVNRRSRRSPATSPRAPQSSPEENTADSYSSPTDAPSPDLENQDLTAQIGGLSLLDDNGNSAEQSTVYDQTRPMRSVTTEVQSTADPHISDDDEWE